MLNRKGMKKAEITLEVVLAVALSTVVLFLILSLFGDNLGKMVNHSRMYQFFNKDNSEAKTAYQTFNKNPTKTQVNVQIVADQANLAWYHSQAQQQIEKLACITTPLTDQQTIDLAKYLTIFSQSGPTGDNPTKVLSESFEVPSNTGITDSGANYPSTQTRNISYKQVQMDHHITIYPDYYKTTFPLKSGQTKTIDWNKYNQYDIHADIDSKEPQRIKNVIAIGEAF